MTKPPLATLDPIPREGLLTRTMMFRNREDFTSASIQNIAMAEVIIVDGVIIKNRYQPLRFLEEVINIHNPKRNDP